MSNKDKEIQALKRELVIVSFMGVPGPIMAVTAFMSLIGGEEYLLHPMLENPVLTVPMLVLGVALVIWEGSRVLPIQAKLRALQTKTNTPDDDEV
ncbi:MAG: hypothetical protein KDI28_11515 [Pseudomonadales bacterium]|nr:hypothetical protein [Pseudomonadales bacterium]